MNRIQLEEGRRIGYRTYDYFHSYCAQMISCETCESRRVRFWCKIKRWIVNRQTKIILRLADKKLEEKRFEYCENDVIATAEIFNYTKNIPPQDEQPS